MILDSFKIQLNFISLLKLSTLVGFCAGIGLIPFNFLYYFWKLTDGVHDIANVSGVPTLVAFVVIGSPFFGALYGVIVGLVGYPMYRWLSARVGIVYRGRLHSVV